MEIPQVTQEDKEFMKELVYKKFLELNVEMKARGYKSSEGDEVFEDPNADTDDKTPE